MLIKYFRVKDKRGKILIQNVMFLILNLIFLSILFTFVFQQANSVSNLEKIYSKKIALSIDSAKPVMTLKIDMKKGMEKAKENGVDFEDAIKIEENNVFVKLSGDSGHSYSFFNDVTVNAYPDKNKQNENNGLYVFTITKNE